MTGDDNIWEFISEVLRMNQQQQTVKRSRPSNIVGYESCPRCDSHEIVKVICGLCSGSGRVTIQLAELYRQDRKAEV